jgi:hypothetical protein
VSSERLIFITGPRTALIQPAYAPCPISQNAAAPNNAAATGASKATESTARPLTNVLRSITVCLQIYFVLNISLIAVAAYGFPVLVV